MKKLSLILFSIIILINFSFTNSSEKNTVKGKARIIDGDTIEINKEKEASGATKDTVTVSRGDIKRRVKRTKAINPLVGRQKKKISNAKKAL